MNLSSIRADFVLYALTAIVASPAFVSAQTWSDFEGFATNASIDGQGGWRATNTNLDQEIVDLGGNKVWRVSNAFSSGSFGDQPFAPGSDQYAGETGSIHDYDSATATTHRFYASFDFWSVTGAAQNGLDVTISPDDGQGRRQSFISLEDNGNGLEIDFYDTQGNDPGSNPNGGFVQTYIANNLSYTDVHNVVFDITFVDGNVENAGVYDGNDIVNIYVDGILVHTGTTWESYWQTTTEGQMTPSIRAIDTLLFRISTGNGATAGNGYYFDNVYIANGPPRVQNLDTGAWFPTIQSAIDAANPGDTLEALPGTYNESPNIDKPLTLQSRDGRDVTTIALQTGPTYVGSVQISGQDVTVDGFTIEGYDGDAGSSQLASSNFVLTIGLGDIVIRNNRLRIGGVDTNTNGDDGIGIINYYNTTTDTASLTITNNDFEPVGPIGRRAFYINPGIDQLVFSGNTIAGNFERGSFIQAKTALVENNTLAGAGTAGSRSGGIGTWGYPDPSIYGHTTFRGNTISNSAGIALYDSSDIVVEENTLSNNDNNVSVIELSFPALDISGIHINGNSMTNAHNATVNNGSTSGVVLDASANWWGTNVGSAIAAATNGLVDYTPWLDSGTDTDGGTDGFQGDFSVLNVDDDSPQSGATSRIQEGIDRVVGSTVSVSPGTYPGNLSLTDDVTLQSTGGAGVTTIEGAGGCAISIDGDNTTIDGFTVTNPTGRNAICADDRNGIAIRNNIVTNVGGPMVSGNHHAIVVESSAAPVDDVVIEDNDVNAIFGSQIAPYGSVSAITIGFSTGNENVTNLVIQNNAISNVQGYTADFGVGGRGAYGILINHGAGLTGMTVGAQVLNNTITNLEGLWAHGIGLEGNTPDALVQGNKISDLIDHKMPSDAIGVQVEANASANSVEIHYNRFTNMAVGIQNVTAGTLVNAENNYWGSDSGPADSSDDAGEDTEVDVGNCTGDPASEINTNGTGSAVNDDPSMAVDYCPWLLGQGTLTLEISDSCPDDADNDDMNGYQVSVELWMRDLLDPATGFQAFVSYDDSVLTFRDDLSSYASLPFTNHIAPISEADDDMSLPANVLSLNGFESPGGGAGAGGTTSDSLLATLVFDVAMDCEATGLDFAAMPNSELSFEGVPLMTGNVASPTVTLDDTPPAITPGTIGDCYPTAAAAEADALSITMVNDNCMGALSISAEAVGTCSATVTITATDDCGNASTHVYNTRIDSDAPMVTQGSIMSCYPTQVDAENAATAATSATDNCTMVGMLTPMVVDVTGFCDKTITVRVEDECGNQTDIQYTTRVDNTAPVVTAGSIDSCYATVAAAEAAAIAATGASDDCPGSLVVTASTTGTCAAVVTVTVTDSCNNMNSVMYNTRIDSEAPVVMCGSVTTPADASTCDAVVTLTATASDNCDGAISAMDITFTIDADQNGFDGSDPTVNGSGNTYTFPTGTTDVRASSTDFCGNVGSCDFTVTVDGTNEVNVVVVLEDVAYDGDRNIRFTAKGPGGCATPVCWPVTFADVSVMGSPKSLGMATIEVPCGDWDEICAKDEQHTLIDSALLVLSGSQFDAVDDLELLSGDTDNDSDVDINDVTLFIAQFGMNVSGPNPCPYNNVRDADFSLNGAVGSEDFSILQPNWLQFTACSCPSPVVAGDVVFSDDWVGALDIDNVDRRRRTKRIDLDMVQTRIDVASLAPEIAAYADLDGDNEITFNDVRIFETDYGFDHRLSDSLKQIDLRKSERGKLDSLGRRGASGIGLQPRR